MVATSIQVLSIYTLPKCRGT